MSTLLNEFSMLPARVSPDSNDDSPFQNAYEHTEQIRAGQTGRWIMFPDDVKGVTAELLMGVGDSGRVEITCATKETIDAGTATGVAWSSGTVNANTQLFIRPATAIRVVSSTGNFIFNARFQ